MHAEIVKDVKVDDVVQVRVSDGKFYASVTKKEDNNNG